VRIPLDYYRILGVPIEATDGQLSQAYRDRSLQLPEQEYSSAALDARKQLLELAYQVLSNPETRAAYNEQLSQWVAPGSGLEEMDAIPSLEIPQEQLMGALLILQELGEYELVLRLAHPYLDSNYTMTVATSGEENQGFLREDLVLTISFTCLELGREQWQQGQYENAAVSGQTGQDLLLRFGLFPGLRREIQADLYKLRPYRILELLALPLEEVDRRTKGLQLLQEMLQERGGIDGQGNDQSGLNIDNFLRFIQQLRSYLTASEQQGLFEAEARRPSAVATYLAVSTLIGRGFAEKKPALILQAKEMLLQLAQRQDVHLEQAICALLLGQTEEANRAVELSQEYEELASIRKHSEGEPDLLPGLCLYGEDWLLHEVLSHFRDLQNNPVSLKEYFAEKQVQAYLENLSGQNEVSPYPSDVGAHSLGQSSVRVNPRQEEVGANLQFADTEKKIVTNSVKDSGAGAWSPLSTEPILSDNQNTYTVNLESVGQESGSAKAGATATITKPRPKPAAKKALQKEKSLSPLELMGQLFGESDKVIQNLRGSSTPLTASKKHSSSSVSSQVSQVFQRKSQRPGIKVRRIKAKIPSLKSLLFLVIIVIFAAGTFGFVVSKLLRGKPDEIVSSEEEELFIQLNQPALVIPINKLKNLSKEEAQKAVEGWLSAKSKAWGSRYEMEELKIVLAEPILSQKLNSAERLKQKDDYWELEHEVTFISLENTGENRAIVTVKVREKANKYESGKLSKADSYDDQLEVKYQLVRQNDRWLIQSQLEVKNL